MKIKKPWSWVVSAVLVITAPVWIVPAVFFGGLWAAVLTFHRAFFED